MKIVYSIRKVVVVIILGKLFYLDYVEEAYFKGNYNPRNMYQHAYFHW
jgi:hypothetical protein